MRDWYARSDVMTEWPDGEILLRDKLVDQRRYFIRLAIEFSGIGKRIFIVEQTQGDLKLDWETAVDYQPMPFADFKRDRPTTPVEFRVKVKTASYYNYQFADPEKYYAVELTYPGQHAFLLFGYIDRTRPWAQTLIRYLELGSAPSIIAEIQFPSGQQLDERQVEIISIISESWWW